MNNDDCDLYCHIRVILIFDEFAVCRAWSTTRRLVAVLSGEPPPPQRKKNIYSQVLMFNMLNHRPVISTTCVIT